MKFLQPIHGHCDSDFYCVVVPVELSVGEITVYVEFDRKTGKIWRTPQAWIECAVNPDKLHRFDATKFVLRKAEVVARQFAGDALPPQVSGLVN